MRLKKLEIRGFKTFADNTEVIFTPGITAVVGPNGSGKSNISDAIAWVMGESNVRHLRANKTEDVIFNGSAKRKAVGLAEVSLTLDNSQGRLPLQFDEITVTRRAYRSGDSEYLINKVPCRLRDIFELFLDSGAGRGAYSMVSQGEIDRLLTGKPEDRRELLEEAAGVKKYRVRRHETYRKLEHTRDNLSRVDDIMREINAQMEPLSEQAEIALRHRDLTERLKEIEVGLLVSRVQKLEADIQDSKEADLSITERLTEIEGQLTQAATSEETASAKARSSQTALEEAHSQHAHAGSAAERLRGDLAVATARRQSVEVGRARINEEIVRLEMRLADLRKQESGGDDEQGETAEAKERFEAESLQLRSKIEELSSRIHDREKTLAEQEVGARGLAEDKAAQRSRLENNEKRKAEIELSIAALEQRLSELSTRRESRMNQSAEAAVVVDSETARAASLSKELESLQQACEDARDNLESSQALLDEAARTIADRTTRLKLLKEMEAAREGYYAGVKAILAAAKRGELPDAYAPVAEILNVPARFDLAMEAALGAQLQDIVTPDFQMASQAIDFLKNRSLGRATFLPMDRLDRSEVWGSEKYRGVQGILGTAYDLIKFDKYYDPAAKLLLGRVLVADSMDTAGDAARQLRGWGKIVTPDGELLVPSGAITGGSRNKKGTGLIERKREITDLTQEIERLTNDQHLAQSAVQQLKSDLQAMARSASDLGAQCNDAKVRLAEAAGLRDGAAASLKEMDDAQREALGRLESAHVQIRDLTDETATLTEMLSSVHATGGSMDIMLEKHRQELGQMHSTRSRMQEALAEISSQISAMTERENAIQRARSALLDDLRGTENAIATRRRELEAINLSEQVTDEGLQDLSMDCNAASAAFEQAKVLLTQAQAQMQLCAQSHQAAILALKDTRDLRDGLSAELHQTQVSLARTESELTQTLDRLWEDYEINKHDALTWPEPLLVKHGTAGEVARLRREIRAMGDVNTGSIAEFERVRERWEFLASQRSDLDEAQASLLQAIQEIDDSTRELFTDTFSKVSANFEEIFAMLFDGGEAKMRLTTPDNLLETGIDVFVQPPGKKLQNMDLLSGGEKALTAQALLFALMRVKPSPFCVLDEVDAPLDDANVGRFAGLVRQFSEDSQFIVITHNRATMEQADVLYGITMKEPGISSIISARLSEV